MSPFVAALVSLTLLGTAELPCGTVRRSSLFGYQLPTGEVLDLEEAAARAEVLVPKPAPRPGLVRLPLPVTTVPEVTMVTTGTTGTTPPEPAPARPEGAAERRVELDPEEAQLFTDEPAPASASRLAPELLAELGGLDFAPDPSNDGVGALDFAPPTDNIAHEDDDLFAAPAIARLCTACKGGQIKRNGGCVRCDGRTVQVWVNNHEITTFARPRSDTERLGVVVALSDLFPELSDRARQGALALFDIATRGASPLMRTRALEHWQRARRSDASL